MILAPNEVAWLALNVGKWTPEQAVTAVAIAYAESGFETEAVNAAFPPNWDLGLFQISTRWNYDKLQVYRWRDPFDNTRAARVIHDQFLKRPEADGWLAWTVYKSGAYKVHLPLAHLGVQHPWEPINIHTTGWRR